MSLRVSTVLASLVAVIACGGDGGGILSTTTSSTTTSAPTTTVGPTTTTIAPSTTTSTTVLVSYPQAAVDYFVEIAFGPEFGGGPREIRKWTSDVEIEVHGEPNADDLITLYDVVADLNAIITTIEIRVVDGDGNVDVHFAPVSSFADIEPNYVSGNMGFFWVWWDARGSIVRSRVLVSTTGLTQQERNHIIREEITQQMGLMSDSYSYPDSVFQQAWTTTQEYSPLDEMLISMLYLPRVEVGMDDVEALAAIGG